MPNSSRSSRYSSACAQVHSPSSSSSARVAVELLALGLHDLRRRLRHELLVGELALRARDLLLELSAPRPRCDAPPPRCRSRRSASTCTAPPGIAIDAIGVAVRSPPSTSSKRASRARCSRGLLVAVGREPPGDARGRRRAHVVALAAQRRGRASIRSARPRASASSSISGGSGSGQLDAASSPRSPGRNDQISSVTNGMIGCSSCEHLLEHVQQRGRQRRLVRVLLVQARLDQLEVPVADLAPEARRRAPAPRARTR